MEIRKIENRIKILRRIFIIGIILSIIGLIISIALMYRLDQLTDELTSGTSEKSLSEINQELDETNVYLRIAGIFTFIGIFLTGLGFRYKRFERLNQSYKNQLEAKTIRE